MSIRLEDYKERISSIAKEFKGERMGMLGLGIIVFMLILAVFAPWIAPDTDGRWADYDRWADNPRNAAPVWADYILPGSRAPHDIREDFDDMPTDEPGLKVIEYHYHNDYDYPPGDISIRVHGRDESASTVQIWIDWIREDGKEITLLDTSSTVGEESREFEERYTIRSDAGRENIYDWAYTYHMEHHPDDEDPPERVDPSRPLFAYTDENILRDPQSQRGDYVLRIEILGEDLEINEEASRVLFRGQIYGLMGTDSNRRDLAQGWIYGARYALITGGIVSIASIAIATVFGMTSAYFGGWVDEAMQRINEILIGIPMFPILIITIYSIGRSIWVFVAVYTILGWRGLAKIIRSRGIQIRQDTYVEAAVSLGSGSGRIILRHMVPQILPYALAEGALMIPAIIIAEAGLSVLGLGDPTIVTFGRMLDQANRGAATVSGYWWWVLLPGIGIILVGFSFIAAGMALERVVNPKMRQR